MPSILNGALWSSMHGLLERRQLLLLVWCQVLVKLGHRACADRGKLTHLGSFACRQLLDLIRISGLNRSLKRFASLPQLLPNRLGGLPRLLKYRLGLGHLSWREIQICSHHLEPARALSALYRLRTQANGA